MRAMGCGETGHRGTGFEVGSWLHHSWDVPCWLLMGLPELHPLDVMAEGWAEESGSSRREPSWLEGRVEDQEPSLKAERAPDIGCPAGPQLTL